MKPLLAVLFACAFALAAQPPAHADTPAEGCADSAVVAVQKRYESVSDLSARFVQESRSVALGAAAAWTRSSGEVVFAKPGRMRWRYLEPEPSLVVSDGQWLWTYAPELGEAQKLPVGDGALSGTAIQFLLGAGDLRETFQVRELGCTAAEARLELTPREPSVYETLRLVVARETGDVRESEVTDLLGNVTRVRFEDVRVDLGPAPDLFHFEAPEGVEVIEIAPPAGS